MFDMGLTVTVEAKSKVGESSSTGNNLESEILDNANIFTMMFVYHYVIIPFHPQYLPRYAPLILQSGGIQGGGIRWPETLKFSLLLLSLIFGNTLQEVARTEAANGLSRSGPYSRVRDLLAKFTLNFSLIAKK